MVPLIKQGNHYLAFPTKDGVVRTLQLSTIAADGTYNVWFGC